MDIGESTSASTEVTVPKLKEEDLTKDKIGKDVTVPSFFADSIACPLDLSDVLRSCGGRITIHDARLLFSAAMHIKAKKIVEIGSADG